MTITDTGVPEHLHATCEDCQRQMNPNVGCTMTHLKKSKDGPAVKRVFYGEEDDDWGAGEGRVCHDCNVGPGQPHHNGCDVERCPECGRQLLMDECGWEYLVGVVK